MRVTASTGARRGAAGALSGDRTWCRPEAASDHRFPGSARCGLHLGEPDLRYWAIRALERLGLAWDVRVPAAGAVRRARGT